MVHSASEFDICAENCTGCMRCSLICSFIIDKTFGYSQAKIKINRVGFEEKYDISFSADCNKCGMCLQYCTFNAIRKREGG